MPIPPSRSRRRARPAPTGLTRTGPGTLRAGLKSVHDTTDDPGESESRKGNTIPQAFRSGGRGQAPPVLASAPDLSPPVMLLNNRATPGRRPLDADLVSILWPRRHRDSADIAPGTSSKAAMRQRALLKNGRRLRLYMGAIGAYAAAPTGGVSEAD
jgi:hypothetical protein